MSLADFQRAFARVVADPEAWAVRLARGAAALDGMQLTPRELDRLRRLARHRGMPANQLLLRSTRAMPLHGALPLTCDWLRHAAPAVMDAWFAASGDASIQYGRETERFAAWLPEFLARTGHRDHPALDALRFERAVAELAAAVAAGRPDAVVTVELRYDPDDILAGGRGEIQAPATPTRARLLVRDGNVVLERDPPAAPPST